MPLNPPPLIDAGVCLVAQPLQRSDMSRRALVTFSLLADATPSLAEAQTAVNQFQTVFNLRLAPLFDTEVTIGPPYLRMGDGTDTPFEATATGTAAVGTNSGTFVNPQAAVLAKKVTGVAGRNNRGRTYYPFCIDNTLISENGTLDNTLVASFDTQLGLFLDGLASDNIPMIVTHKIIDHGVTPPAVIRIEAGPPVTSYLCETMVATQRRRLGRNG